MKKVIFMAAIAISLLSATGVNAQDEHGHYGNNQGYGNQGYGNQGYGNQQNGFDNGHFHNRDHFREHRFAERRVEHRNFRRFERRHDHMGFGDHRNFY